MFMQFAMGIVSATPAQYKAYLDSLPSNQRRKAKAFWDKYRKDPSLLWSAAGGGSGGRQRDAKGRFVKRNPRRRGHR